MTVITNRLIPLMKSHFSDMIKWSKGWNRKETGIVLDAFWLRMLIVACICPVFIAIPALAFRLAADASSIPLYALSIVLLIPWLLLPTLFIQHIASHSKTGKILSFILLGILIAAYILWIFILNLPIFRFHF